MECLFCGGEGEFRLYPVGSRVKYNLAATNGRFSRALERFNAFYCKVFHSGMLFSFPFVAERKGKGWMEWIMEQGEKEDEEDYDEDEEEEEEEEEEETVWWDL